MRSFSRFQCFLIPYITTHLLSSRWQKLNLLKIAIFSCSIFIAPPYSYNLKSKSLFISFTIDIRSMKDKIKPKINLFFVTVVYMPCASCLGVFIARIRNQFYIETFHPPPPLCISDTRTRHQISLLRQL